MSKVWIKLLFTIGQVTRMYHLQHDTLRYYDKIGLLKPTLKKDNGYRYYTIRDLELLEFILLSRQLDIPIKRLKDILVQGDIAEYTKLFSNHEAYIEEKIKKLNELKKDVIRFKQKTIEMEAFENYELPDVPTYKYINKKILFINQNGEESLAEIVKNKDLILPTKKNQLEELIIDSDLIGFEIFKEEFFELEKYKTYSEYHLKGTCIVLSRKDTPIKLVRYINEAIHKYGAISNLRSDVCPVIECTFNLVRNNDSTIHFANIYIPID